MDLWIRSQDREKLICCNDIAIATGNEYKIVGYFDKNTEYEDLGFYLTKERALEVLDEIQKTMCLDEFNYENKEKTSYQDCYYKSNIIAIYEMPKE